MSEKEIVIPISKVKTKPDLAFEKKYKNELDFEINEIVDDFESEAAHTLKVSKEGQILVKFPKFVQLIATHEFEEIIEKHKNEDVIITSDLLVDLAGSTPMHEEPQDYRFSWMFLGLVLGVSVAAIVFLYLL
jgi:hypothetical protein